MRLHVKMKNLKLKKNRTPFRGASMRSTNFRASSNVKNESLKYEGSWVLGGGLNIFHHRKLKKVRQTCFSSSYKTITTQLLPSISGRSCSGSLEAKRAELPFMRRTAPFGHSGQP